MSNKQKTKTLQAEKIVEALEKAENINDLFGKDGIINRIIKPTAEAMMRAELTDHLGYSKYSSEGINSGNNRNGYYKKKVRSSAGDMELEVPRDRNGDFHPNFLDQYSICTNEIEEKIITMYSRGTTVRDIEATLEEIYAVTISPTLISTITDRVLPLVDEWQNRPLDKVYAIIYLDCIHIKQRCEGKVENIAIYIVMGIDLEGKKDILGFWTSSGGESSNYWLKVVTELKNRGVEDILICCFDGLNGFKEAIHSIYPKCDVQRCIIHQIRNTLKYISWKDRREFMKDLKTVYKADTKNQAEKNLEALEKKWNRKYAIAVKKWVDDWDDLSTYFDFTPEIRKLIYTTNIIEGFNRQIRKVTKNKGVFPTENAVKKMFYLATMDISRKWTQSVRGWKSILNQLAIKYEGRFTI